MPDAQTRKGPHAIELLGERGSTREDCAAKVLPGPAEVERGTEKRERPLDDAFGRKGWELRVRADCRPFEEHANRQKILEKNTYTYNNIHLYLLRRVRTRYKNRKYRCKVEC